MYITTVAVIVALLIGGYIAIVLAVAYIYNWVMWAARDREQDDFESGDPATDERPTEEGE